VHRFVNTVRQFIYIVGIYYVSMLAQSQILRQASGDSSNLWFRMVLSEMFTAPSCILTLT